MCTKPRVRKDLNADALFLLARRAFERIEPNRPQAVDALMSGLALFSLKDPSLLAFEDRRTDETIKAIYHIGEIPSDTYMRRILDEVDYTKLSRVFTKILAQLQRGKGLEDMVFYDGHYLISNDGTGYFSSERVHCSECLVKQKRNGTTTYHHSFLGSVIVHPGHKVVLPLCPEPIKNTDGTVKNDCERNASTRFVERFRREHPHLKAIVVEDALASNAPHLRDLAEHDVRYIIGIKPGSHRYLFSLLEGSRTQAHEMTDHDSTHHRFRFLTDVALNESSPDVRVNVVEYWETKKDGSMQHFTWVTDLPVTRDNVYTLMRGARARWKIENETFNTLKNQGYHFEHTFGHGHKNLSTVFALLMMLAFLIDQIQQKLCPVFQAALASVTSKRSLWEKVRGAVMWRVFYSMHDILAAIIDRRKEFLAT